ncbi:hypothetical protein MES5069_860009 [Mesorhizobium escarrei]|uniref:Uncharacterized protein n=1 Tax=Mesorhizobium escarrei TaxID=666018 RepID=A0ABN8KKX0_9HYPH|nr:hypothetical protein MES5069_860009 [Mesorhizobium escarrei]
MVICQAPKMPSRDRDSDRRGRGTGPGGTIPIGFFDWPIAKLFDLPLFRRLSLGRQPFRKDRIRAGA